MPGGDEPVIAYSSLRAAFPSSDGQAQCADCRAALACTQSLEVPKAVLAALQGNFAVDLTTDAAVTRMRSCVCLECTVWVVGYAWRDDFRRSDERLSDSHLQKKTSKAPCLEARGLTQQGLERILESGGDAHFGVKVLESLGFAREAVVDSLVKSQPTILHLPLFRGVPADSWERLGASLDRHRLRKVNLYRRLGLFLERFLGRDARGVSVPMPGRAKVLPLFWRGLQGAASRAGAVPQPEGPKTRDLCTIPQRRPFLGSPGTSSHGKPRPRLRGPGLGASFPRSWSWTGAGQSRPRPGQSSELRSGRSSGRRASHCASACWGKGDAGRRRRGGG